MRRDAISALVLRGLAHEQAHRMATLFSMYVCMHAIHESSGGQNMAGRSKKERAAGREQHRQLQRAKKMKKKQKKNLELPQRHKKNKG